MSKFIVDRYTNICDILVQVGECRTRSEAKMVARYDHVFIDNKRVDEYYEIDFVLTHKVDKLYDKFKGRVMAKQFSILRVGGNWNPDDPEGGRKYKLVRLGSLEGKVEMFR